MFQCYVALHCNFWVMNANSSKLATDKNFIFGTQDHKDSPDMTHEKNFETVCGQGHATPKIFLALSANSSKLVISVRFFVHVIKAPIGKYIANCLSCCLTVQYNVLFVATAVVSVFTVVFCTVQMFFIHTSIVS